MCNGTTSGEQDPFSFISKCAYRWNLYEAARYILEVTGICVQRERETGRKEKRVAVPSVLKWRFVIMIILVLLRINDK